MSDDEVDFNELMQEKGYSYLEKIIESKENSLQLLINRSTFNIDLPLVQLEFESYISYSVIDECFSYSIDNSEISKGELFRLYTKSRYLDYIKIATNEREDICPSENYIHYQFLCLNHTIDVISCEEPKINVVTG
ncbi:hypothetical protein QUF94_23695 [Peribacillus sp. NJ4]|uniref:hypothetical protein n=1 Tax=unclassified Peribacillus TaxID=2675266 RepID=UPI0025A07156|nr:MULTISPECIES: hypothetical protein [unclassified Peribacillus]MDM5214391.1 hypothetical protein [Peribacillus sp. NJ4]MDM5219686.1 hypothetical protein [Peribacillus sp. NJ11]